MVKVLIVLSQTKGCGETESTLHLIHLTVLDINTIIPLKINLYYYAKLHVDK